jgi:hypothetical protein
MCATGTLPMLLVRDFNILRRPEHKSNDNYNPRWPFIFNAIIENLNLREIFFSSDANLLGQARGRTLLSRNWIRF